MQNQLDIINIQKNLLENIEQRFNSKTEFSEIAQLSESMDRYIEEFLVECIFEHHQYIFGAVKINKKDYCINKGGVYYNVAICTDIGDSNSIVLKILARDEKGKALKYKTLPVLFDHFGRYQKMRILYNIDCDTNNMASIIKNIYDTTYKWFLNEKLKAMLDNEKISMTKEIYSRIKLLIPHEDIWPKVWFGAVSKEEGVYLLDHDNVTRSLITLRQKSSIISANPFKLVSEFINTVLPYAKMMAKEAINSHNESLDVDLTNALYHDEKNTYTLSEIGIYGSNSITIYPLIKQGSLLLIACFPTEHKAVVLPILKSNRQLLADNFISSSSKINRALKILKNIKIKLPISPIVEACAAFCKGAGWLG